MTFPPDATQTTGRYANSPEGSPSADGQPSVGPDSTLPLARPTRSPERAQPGAVIAERYELTARVGDGGHGTVWRARDRLLQRDVAVKEILLPPNLPEHERQQLCDRTLREAQAAASLSHASVVRVFDVVTEAGLPWIVMELLKARSLADIIATDGPMPPRVVAKVGLSLIGALEAAHAAGILHRDIKPGNVLISSDGRCVLSDFGAAAGVAGTGHTAPGMVLGSAHYIAPERAVGGQAVPASDLFSLGVTLYAAVEGRPPFDRADTTATMNAVVHEPPEAPQRAAELTPLLAGLLEKDPNRRAGADYVRNTLSALLSGSLASEHSTAMPTSGGPISGIPGNAAAGVSATSAPPATTAMPSYGAPQGFGPPPPAQDFGQPAGMAANNPLPPATGNKKPSRMALALGAGLGVIVLLIVVVLGIGLFSGNGEDDSTDNAGKEEKVDDDPGFKTKSYADPDDRFSVDVPKTWKADAKKPQFSDPNNGDRWIKFDVGGPVDAKKFLEDSAHGLDGTQFTKGSLDLKDSKKAKLSGKDGWIVEYAGTRIQDHQTRHAMWALATVGDQSFQIYLSVPDDTWKDSERVFDHALKSYKLAS